MPCDKRATFGIVNIQQNQLSAVGHSAAQFPAWLWICSSAPAFQARPSSILSPHGRTALATLPGAVCGRPLIAPHDPAALVGPLEAHQGAHSPAQGLHGGTGGVHAEWLPGIALQIQGT